MKYLVFILFVFVRCSSDHKTASPASIKTDSISIGSLNLRDSLSASIDALDSLKPVVAEIKAQLQEHERLKAEYENKEAVIIRETKFDSSEVAALRIKLNQANNEIARLRGDLASIERKRNISPVVDTYAVMVQPRIETPDENAIIITLDGRSKRRGDLPTDNLVVCLIPYSNKVKHMMSYDSSCNEFYSEVANYYNGVYFFNDVPEGKYIIKVCTYMGDWRKIKKDRGRYNLTMQISPPIQ